MAFRSALQTDAANVLHHIFEFLKLERLYQKRMRAQIVCLLERLDVGSGQHHNGRRGMIPVRTKPAKNVAGLDWTRNIQWNK